MQQGSQTANTPYEFTSQHASSGKVDTEQFQDGNFYLLQLTAANWLTRFIPLLYVQNRAAILI